MPTEIHLDRDNGPGIGYYQHLLVTNWQDCFYELPPSLRNHFGLRLELRRLSNEGELPGKDAEKDSHEQRFGADNHSRKRRAWNRRRYTQFRFFAATAPGVQSHDRPGGQLPNNKHSPK